MAATDWRVILSLSEKELLQTDKEKLCESLAWMEADDIELNFSDLKTLFRLAQDIIKYKSEQVKNLWGELDSIKGRNGRKKSPKGSIGNLTRIDTAKEEVDNQKRKYSEEKNKIDKENESSPDPMSELDATAQLENEIFSKNRHIRKLLGYVKILEEDNLKLKDKISMLKDKLKEATKIIEDLTDQMLNVNKEYNRLKENLGSLEQTKSRLLDEISALRQEIISKSDDSENVQHFKEKNQHLKNLVRTQRIEIEKLSSENKKLQGNQVKEYPSVISVEKRDHLEELKTKELVEKLVEASNEIMRSANFIELLKAENKQLKLVLEETRNSFEINANNESDDRKQCAIINRLKKKNHDLRAALQNADEMIVIKENEIYELSSKLELLQLDEGIGNLLKDAKNKKMQLKIKDEQIKSTIKDINKLNSVINELQLENEIMRRKLKLDSGDKIPTEGILFEYHNLKTQNLSLYKELQAMENELVALDIKNREQKTLISKYTKILGKAAVKNAHTDQSDMVQDEELNESVQHEELSQNKNSKEAVNNTNQELNYLIEENEGLRKGLQEIFNILKEGVNSSSGVFALESPSLEALLHSLEARHIAGWLAPHMATVLELKAALGGKEALLLALNQSRKENFDLMKELSKESQKCVELQNKLLQSENQFKVKAESSSTDNINFSDFNSWLDDNEDVNIDPLNKGEIEKFISKRNSSYERKVRNVLLYFRNKFKMLYDKMAEISLTSEDEKSKWLIQEEKYKAQIENLTAFKTSEEDEDSCDISPGLVTIHETSVLERKCVYLEESYKNIRTSYENIKNELLEHKKNKLTSNANFDIQVQNLILIIINLSEKISHLIPEEVFWKQNRILNETIVKNRQLVEADIRKIEFIELFSRLENNKAEAIESILKQLRGTNSKFDVDEQKSVISLVENTVTQKQMKEVCLELDKKNKQIEELLKSNKLLQESQTRLIDNNLASESKEEIKTTKDKVIELSNDNTILKEQCKQLQCQLDILKLKINDNQFSRFEYETEINMLKHQILDLQSVGDGKAIIARLNNEILVAHLQISESHKAIENLQQTLMKEKERRTEAEEALKTQHRLFDIFSLKYENKFRYMYEVIQTLRLQYQGTLPFTSVENYLYNLHEFNNKNNVINKKLVEIEDLRYSLMTKHSVYDQILKLTKANCTQDVEACQHKLQLMVMLGTQSKELEHSKIKTRTLLEENEKLLERCNYLEENLVLINQGLRDSLNSTKEHNVLKTSIESIKVEDVQSDTDSKTRESETYSLPKPRTTQLRNQIDFKVDKKKNVATSTNFPELLQLSQNRKTENVSIQTNVIHKHLNSKLIQTDKDNRLNELSNRVESLVVSSKEKEEKLSEYFSVVEEQTKRIQSLNEENKTIQLKNKSLSDTNSKLIALNEKLDKTIESLRIDHNNLNSSHLEQLNKIEDEAKEKIESLLLKIQKIENEKNNVVLEYKQLLEKEREENYENVKSLQLKIVALQTEMDKMASVTNSSDPEIMKNSVAKYRLKITELEDKCFKLQNNLEDYKTEIVNCQNELERWKTLASERLEKMEQMSTQLKERHNYEVESYKAENKHWLEHLNETQQEHIMLRSRLTEDKALHVKQLSEKDAQIDQLRSDVHNLKTQLLNMQTMLSVHDPSFDLSAIVEVEEESDVSQQRFDRLELNFETAVDLHEMHDDFSRMATSTTIWQEPLIERLRREKQLLSKQNGVLRRQIKAVAARERRSRLDAQNLKNQVFRISTSGSKAVSAESTALHNKIASLQAQLLSARRDAHSSVAMWDKWKRAQQSAERWEARYNEKFKEVTKLEASLNLAKSAVTRLEKEKRVLLSRLDEIKERNQCVTEKQMNEASEKPPLALNEYGDNDSLVVPVSARALLERVEAQQRRIVALEVAEKGNEPLVSEYEKALAKITSLQGQVLKLESTLLESQIRSPLKDTEKMQPELEYWKSYCNMLKEENTQLTIRVNALESIPTTVNQHRVNDLEQTVLTLRGLVSKLQAEQKSSAMVQKRVDCMPNSGSAEKVRSQLESCKTEISNLKRSIQEKDALLERSKDMLRIAAEREDELLRENSFLRHRLEEMKVNNRGSLSA